MAPTIHSPPTRANTQEDALCDAIRAEALRHQIAGTPLTLSLFLDAHPDLADHPAALDTAISLTIRDAASRGVDRDRAVDALSDRHPDLRSAILAADFLDHAFDDVPAAPIVLPCLIGPQAEPSLRRYQLTERIGEGTFGTMYRARDTLLGDSDRPAWVAVKILRPEHRRSAADLRSEAVRARRVVHPGVVRMLDLGIDPEHGEFLVCELCDGLALDQWVMARRGNLPAREAVGLVARLAEALSIVHAAGLCHGDVHPRNVIITPAGEPKLIDFGAARSEAALRSGEGPVGALGFLAPEVYTDPTPSLNAATDLYSLAGILYWLVSGTFPNGRTQEEVEATLEGEREIDPSPVRGALAAHERDLVEILSRALAREPRARYATVELFARDLERWLRHEPPTWKTPGMAHRARLSVRRAPRAWALGAGIGLMLALALPAIVAAFLVAMRSARLQADSALSAARSEAGAVEARAIQAEAERERMELGRQMLASIWRLVDGLDANASSLHYVVPLVFLEEIAATPELSSQLLREQTRAKRKAICYAAIREGAVPPGSLAATLLVGAAATWHLEDGEYELAGALIRDFAHGLPADDPLALRFETLRAAAEILAHEAGAEPTEDVRRAWALLDTDENLSLVSAKVRPVLLERRGR